MQISRVQVTAKPQDVTTGTKQDEVSCSSLIGPHGESVRSAAVSARISSDQDGTALGVARQLEDCRKLAASLGWVVGEEYVDNDLSAYSGKPRPEYQRMLLDLADGARVMRRSSITWTG